MPVRHHRNAVRYGSEEVSGFIGIRSTFGLAEIPPLGCSELICIRQRQHLEISCSRPLLLPFWTGRRGVGPAFPQIARHELDLLELATDSPSIGELFSALSGRLCW